MASDLSQHYLNSRIRISYYWSKHGRSTTREGGKDIKFRMEVVDNMVERELLSDYKMWLADKAEERKEEHDKSFWSVLLERFRRI